MNQTLIGEEVTLVSRAGEDLLQLLLGAAEAFLQAADAAPTDMAGTEGRLRSALAGMTSDGSDSLVARLVIVEGGIQIHLASPAGADGDVTVPCPA